MSGLTVLSVVGARPNFMKLAPVARALAAADARHHVVHTGQHYDVEMSATFFDDLGMGKPDTNLEVGSGTHGQQTAAIMERFEPVCARAEPRVVLVYGDVNSTVAAALVAAKLGVPVGHVEAGLRSNDWSMPEEINRVVTDRLATLLFTPSRDADANLVGEGVPAERIHFVGNVMIDTLVASLPAARARGVPARFDVEPGRYALATLHRPSNVDQPEILTGLVAALDAIAQQLPVVFPVHPRTRRRLGELGLAPDRVRLMDPLGYLDMLGLLADAGVAVTDSGGVQEESSFLGIPCVTVRPNTERPITCREGTNRLVASDRDAVVRSVAAALEEDRREVEIERWDGRAAQRIAEVLNRLLA